MRRWLNRLFIAVARSTLKSSAFIPALAGASGAICSASRR
jgi:hypothetical protein